jgi:hypothetical protein
LKFSSLIPALIVTVSLISGRQVNAATPTHQKTISVTKAYFLNIRGPSRKKLFCYLSNGKLALGIDPRVKSGKVNYLVFKATKSQKKLLNSALKECNDKLNSPACSDGCDNDGDGFSDYPNDPQCSSAAGATETTAPAGIAACSDGIDNDNDGKIDYPDDPGCVSASDNDESNPAEVLNEFSVFRKPFASEYSISSMFDHRYALEFIHIDGSILTHNNEETTVGQDGHQGYDYAMDQGTEVLAAYDGTVVFAGNETPFFCPPLNSTVSGKSVEIRHHVGSEIFDSIYGHFSSIAVANGQVVTKGQVIGLSGTSGCSTGPHLHFDIQRRTNTNGGTPASIDPSGWTSNSPDPWESHASGTQSFRLWASGQAPQEYRFFSLAPNPSPGNSAAVAITKVRWAGINDNQDPNNEYVELTIDPRFYPDPTYPLGGCTLRNNLNERFTFPAGYRLPTGQTIRVYSGSGVDTATEFYWGRTSGAWNNNGDCLHLIRPTGNVTYAIMYGHASCTTLSSTTAADVSVQAVELHE